MKQKLAVLALAMLALAPVASAHGAPAPASHEVRVVHDDNDDTTQYALMGQGVLDNIALDVREMFHLAYGEMIVFKLTLNNACSGFVPIAAGCGTITQSITFDAPSGSKEITLQSEDEGATWTSDALYLVQPYGINDGERFAVEVGVPFSQLDIAAGDALTNFFASTDLSGTEGDAMPGNALGAPEVYVPPAQAELRFSIDSYTVRAPDYYMGIAIDQPLETIELAFNEVEERTLVIMNPLEVPQTFTIFGQGPTGFHTSFSDGTNSDALLTFSLPEGGAADIQFTGHNGATKDADGIFNIHLLSSGGGYFNITAPIHIKAQECGAETAGHGHEGREGRAMETHEGHAMEATNSDCGPDHAMEEHEDTEEHHMDGHEHAEEGHSHSDEADAEETPFVGSLATIALLGAVLALRRK